uniref:Dephospho-CoA kinase n=1 Tax=Solanum tuberosum TaxID=4113 RepID=M1CNR7_SOLTU
MASLPVLILALMIPILDYIFPQWLARFMAELLVGLAHFSVGYIFTYAAFLIASTSGKYGQSFNVCIHDKL